MSIPLLALSLSGCGGCGSCQDKNVVSQRYIHKYGYDVAPTEWREEQYPGQVVTTMRDGKTITSTYEDGQLHGQRIETYPHSQTSQTLEQYERGVLKKRISYNVRGVPQKEEVFHTDGRVSVTSWYPKGTPQSLEEYADGILCNGKYFNLANDIDSRVENGTGEKTIRNQHGDILSKEVYNNYEMTYVETYYANNMPHTSNSYENGKLHGEQKVFAMTGEPLSVENYVHGLKHGLSTYYQNGVKYLETMYALGYKEGMERQFIDGEVISEETEYHEGVKHGPSVLYCDGSAKTSWYFDNQKVSRAKYEELVERHNYIMSMKN